MNVKTAFLNGNIEEELYMVQPKGFISPGDVGSGGARGYAGCVLAHPEFLLIFLDRVVHLSRNRQ